MICLDLWSVHQIVTDHRSLVWSRDSCLASRLGCFFQGGRSWWPCYGLGRDTSPWIERKYVGGWARESQGELLKWCFTWCCCINSASTVLSTAREWGGGGGGGGGGSGPYHLRLLNDWHLLPLPAASASACLYRVVLLWTGNCQDYFLEYWPPLSHPVAYAPTSYGYPMTPLAVHCASDLLRIFVSDLAYEQIESGYNVWLV